ncbi:MAG: hypothetical protein M3545_04195, partial [Acidobacteriota bacterium]|nr:hypothetical protein [Acidobacteriota bacterium]
LVQQPKNYNTQKASFRISGSIDMLGAVRTAYLFGASPATPDDRAMIPFKSNISGGVGALGYRIDKSSGDFSWTGPSKLTRENVLSGREDDILKDATEFLRAALAGGARPSNDVMEEMRANAFSGPTINRAKKAAGVKGTPVHGKGKKGVQKWMWML